MEKGRPVSAGAGQGGGGGGPGCSSLRREAGGLDAAGAGEVDCSFPGRLLLGSRRGRFVAPATRPLGEGWLAKQPGEAGGGGDAASPLETQLALAWHWFLRGQEELRKLEELRQQLAEEMREVENYVDHVRTLTEARDALAAEYERENEQLRMEFTQLQLEHESQHKEVEDMLGQEGLLSIMHSSPGEQVAYLLVERSALLEKIEALGGSPCPGRACVAPLQGELNQFHQRSDEELHEQQQSTTHIKATKNKSPSGELAGGNTIHGSAEQGLDEAPGRLQSAQDEIPVLNEELDVPKGEQGRLSDSVGPGPEIWKEEMDTGKDRAERPIEQFAPCTDARRHPISVPDPIPGAALEREILLLRDRLCFLEAERKTSLGDTLPGTDTAEDPGGCFGHIHVCLFLINPCWVQMNLFSRLPFLIWSVPHWFSRLFNQELHNYKSELLHLYGELQVFQGAAEERDFLHLTHEKLLQKNALLETKVLELSHECERLNQCMVGERKKREGVLASRLSCPEPPVMAQVCGEQILSQAGGRDQKRIPLLEASKMGEPEKWAQGQQEEEAQLLKDILALQRQLSAHRDTPGAGFGLAQPREPWVSLGSACGDTEQGPPHKEELRWLRWDSWGAQGPCGSAEKQLRLEQEKSSELKKQNLELQQENVKIQAELRQVQAKLSESSKACAALSSQGELGQMKVKELELQLLQQSQAMKQEARLREQLAQESERAAKAEQRVLELQQMLDEAGQKGRLLETHTTVGRKQLEEEAREKEAEARRHLQEEWRKRVLWEQQRDEQQQQLRRLREKEAQLLQALAERQAQCQQQEAQLRVLEEERRTLSKECLCYQAHSQKLSEQLSALQQEKETLCDEQRQVLKQVDISLRKYNERRLRHKARLRHTREALLGEVKQRDGRIRHLENEIQLSKSQAEKDQTLIRRVTSENEGLFREKRKILQQLHRLEEAGESSGQILCAVQSRVQLLEGENKQLQDRTLQLSLQVGILERALRTIHVHSLEDLKSISFPEGLLQRKLLPFPSFSFSVTELSDSCSLRPAIKDRQPSEPVQRALLSPLAFQTSEISYLNITIPRSPADPRKDEPGRPVCCDRV
ncbi:coiled-coil domain-containing protein 30 [Candoia aspera]|uniref:coiled-coil domain-containing protein 30 n=1 Tax=Candoia aspera TaxID=51853 RepID=UPI002FD7C69F